MNLFFNCLDQFNRLPNDYFPEMIMSDTWQLISSGNWVFIPIWRQIVHG